MSRTVLAADIGGTHVRGALVDETGTVRERRDEPTPAGATAGQLIELIAQTLGGIARGSNPPPVGACIAVPGLVNAAEGKIVVAPNVPGFHNLVLDAPMEERLGLPVTLENDASAAALGEFRFGAGKGTRNLLHVTVGTGVGGGLVIEGRLYRGATGFAGEIGHIVLDPGGPQCNCGSRGCMEALVSGVAFANRARRLLARDASPVLKEIAGYRDPTSADLFAAAKAGDRACEAEIRNGGHLLGLGIGSLVNVLNPDAVTLSGGMLAMGEMFLGPVRDAMRGVAYASAGTPLRLSDLGDDAGLLGAAAVAFEHADSGRRPAFEERLLPS